MSLITFLRNYYNTIRVVATRLTCILLFILFTRTVTVSQTTTVTSGKIGLCLSGGGAKGLAHVGLLKLIDSLGIKIDYVTGTSMGSIIGGLYASGWTGLQIDSIIKSADWDQLLSQYVPMNEIYSDEKDEYGRYIGELPIRNRKLSFTGFIEGQKLMSLLSKLTDHVGHINDFSKLPIPFKCMAVDIINAKPVTMDHGNLAIAMRASMAIPTVFKPVTFEDMLLVDGGLITNFPVNTLKEMGATFIIGSYTGGRLLTEKEMNTVNKLLIQSNSFYGISKAKDEIKICNILNNLTENMKQFNAGDFKKSTKIIKAGEQIVYKIRPALCALADSLAAKGLLSPKPPLIQSSSTFFKIGSITIDSCSKQTRKFITHRLSLKDGDLCSFNDLSRNVKRIYGSRFFYKATYALSQADSQGIYNVNIKFQRDDILRFKGGLHYDTELGAGFMLNLTARNLLGTHSRLLATIDIAQFFKYRIHYRYYLNQTQTSLNLEFLREKSAIKEYDPLQKPRRDYYNLYRSFNSGFNINLGIPAAFYSGIGGEINQVDAKYKAAVLDVVSVQNISSLSTFIKNRFLFNTLDHPLIPRKGTKVFIEHRLTPISIQMANFQSINIDTNGVVKTTDFKDTAYYLPYNKIQADIKYYLPLHPKISVMTGLQTGFIFNSKQKNESTSGGTSPNIINGNPVLEEWFFGGVIQRTRSNQIPMTGLHENGLSTPNFASLNLGVQFEPIRKLFLLPAFTYLYRGSSTEHFMDYIGNIQFANKTYTDADLNTYNSSYSYGLIVTYKSPLGPLSVSISKSSIYYQNSDPVVYLSMGYHF